MDAVLDKKGDVLLVDFKYVKQNDKSIHERFGKFDDVKQLMSIGQMWMYQSIIGERENFALLIALHEVDSNHENPADSIICSKESIWGAVLLVRRGGNWHGETFTKELYQAFVNAWAVGGRPEAFTVLQIVEGLAQ